ncbi:Beta-galactosidase [Halotydeus destructor]|nr:Beta-galactosidase [Halotydeus destructor]
MVSRWPMTFDQLQVDGGYVIYKTTIDFIARHPSLLSIPGLRDRAQVILNGQLVGTLSRNDEMYKMPLQAPKNSELVIVVENQGRLNFDPGMAAESVKGIIGNVTFGSQNLTNWTQYYNLLNIGCRSTSYGEPSLPTLLAPAVYAGSFMIPAGSEGLDTFLRLDGWGKGVAFVNGNHLGRYWPDEGPQVTLYVPHVWLKPKALNYIYVFETDHAPCHDKAKCFVSFTETHVLNGTYPVNELFRQFPQ